LHPINHQPADPIHKALISLGKPNLENNSTSQLSRAQFSLQNIQDVVYQAALEQIEELAQQQVERLGAQQTRGH
jgi:hypothetical protein